MKRGLALGTTTKTPLGTRALEALPETRWLRPSCPQAALEMPRELERPAGRAAPTAPFRVGGPAVRA